MKNLISRPNYNLILILLCGFVFLTSTNVQGQVVEKPDKFFQRSGIKMSLSLPILIDYSNDGDTKPFDTYQVGLDFNPYIKSREIFPKGKFEFNASMFAMLSLQNPDVDLPDNNLIGAGGIKAGASLILMDAIGIGASFPLGFGNTIDAPNTYRTIVGINPSIESIITPKLGTWQVFVKCEFPIWRNKLRTPSPGLIISLGIKPAVEVDETKTEPNSIFD